jgi:signal transduction histidine kinase
MLTPLKPKSVLILAIGLMVMGASLAGFTIAKFYIGEKWVRHTYQVLLEIGQLQTDLSKVGRYRRAFLDSGDAHFVKDFSEARQQLAIELASLHMLTVDNLQQQANCYRLDAVVDKRLETLQESIEAGGSPNTEAQQKFTDEVVRSAFETSAITDGMQRVEESLLEHRRTITASLFTTILIILLAAFCLSIVMFVLNYRMLSKELDDRRIAESNAQSLSAALMRVQDEERRKFSREMHDSLGQVLAGAKMLAGQVSKGLPGDARMPELEAMLEDAVRETRTLSHLLHPPLLDEIGFTSAARWFTDNYSQRTGIAVDFDCPRELPELPKSLELVMFRVMQESLTNVHKHSRSSTAQVRVSVHDQNVSLEVADNGIGIPADMLEAFLSRGTGVGVGLAGIKQRVKEHGGVMSVRSDANSGTVVSVSFNLAALRSEQRSAAAG